MAKYIPINKKTGVKYPAITEAEMKKWLEYPSLYVGADTSNRSGHKYRYEEVKEKAKVNEPIEALKKGK